jgi:hypothetical protein
MIFFTWVGIGLTSCLIVFLVVLALGGVKVTVSKKEK